MGFMVLGFDERRAFWRRATRVIAPLVGLTMVMAASAASPALEVTGPVEVSLYENLPEPPQPENPGEGYNKKYAQHAAGDIDLTGLKPSMRYTERAFGFPGIPTKFSKNGLALDYSEPFVLKDTMERALPREATSSGCARRVLRGSRSTGKSSRSTNRRSLIARATTCCPRHSRTTALRAGQLTTRIKTPWPTLSWTALLTTSPCLPSWAGMASRPIPRNCRLATRGQVNSTACWAATALRC